MMLAFFVVVMKIKENKMFLMPNKNEKKNEISLIWWDGIRYFVKLDSDSLNDSVCFD